MTVKQKALYDYIKQYNVDHGYAPSTLDMADHLGVSRQACHIMCKRLQDDGYITMDGVARSVRIVSKNKRRKP